MKSKRELAALIREAVAEIEHIEKMGEDIWDPGTVILVKWDTIQGDRDAAVWLKLRRSGADKWVRTGSSDIQSWSGVVEFIYGMRADVVSVTPAGSEVWTPYETEQPLRQFEFDEAAKRAKLAEDDDTLVVLHPVSEDREGEQQ